MTRKLLPDLFAVAVLLLIPLLLFAPVTLGNHTLLPIDAIYTFEPYATAAEELHATPPQNALLADLILQNYPWKRFLLQAIGERELPLWDPYIFGGHPFLANGQHAGLYPLSAIYYLLPLPRAYGVFTVVQLGLAGLWMYVLARVIGARRTGSLLAGIAFELCGFLVVSAVHPMIIAAASWLPLLLALCDLTIRQARFMGRRATLPWALLGAAALGMQILAGHAEVTYFVLLTLGAFAAWRLGYVAATTPRATWRQELLSPALLLLVMVVLGLCLGAVQLIPLYEVVQGSFRQSRSTLQDILGWAYPPRRVLTFLIPNFFGNPTHHTLRDVFTGQTVPATVNAYGQSIDAFDWGIKNYVEGGAYLGVLPLLLALLAVLAPLRASTSAESGVRRALLRWIRHPYIPFFTLLALFSLGCIFGTPVYTLVYYLPFLNQSHSPFRWIFPLSVSVAALAALGATEVARWRVTHGPDGGVRIRYPRRLWQRLLYFDTAPNLVSLLGVSALWSGLLLLAGLWVSRLAFPTFEPWIERAFWSLAKAPDAFPDYRAFYSYLFPWVQLAGLHLLLAGITLRVSRCPIYLPVRLGRRPVWQLLAVVALTADLVTFGWGFNPAVDPALLEYVPPPVEFLHQDTSLWRFSTFDPHGSKVFNANVGMFYDFQDVRGYDSLFSAQYARYMGWIEPQGELLYNRIAPFKSFAALDSPLTDLLNIKYILTVDEIPLPKYRLVYQHGATRIYENLGVMPRAYSLPLTATMMVPNVEAIGTAIQQYDPRLVVLVEAGDVGWIGPENPLRAFPSLLSVPGTPQAQPVADYTPNQVVIEATLDAPGWLVLTDAYYPGWKAFARPAGTPESEEVELGIARITGQFRGVRLESGAWTVRFKYSPDSVKVGAFASFLAGMTWLFLAALWLWRHAYRETGDESTVQRVAKNSLAPILLNLFNRMIDFALAALMLRILGPADAGDYYYAIVIFGWFDILTNFGLNVYLTREVARERAQANRYLFNTTAMRLLLSGLGIPALIAFLALRQGLVVPQLNAATLWAIGLLYLGLIPNSISTGLSALFYAYERAEYPAAIQTFSALLKATLGAAVLLAGWGIVGLAGASVVISSITLGVLAILSIRYFFRPTWQLDRSLFPDMLRESWPLMLNHLLASLFFKIDVVVLEALKGSAIVGWYSTAYKFLDALNVIPAMFTMAVFPIVSRQAREDPTALVRFYKLSVKLLVTLALPIAILTTLSARELVLVLGDQAFLPHSMIALQVMIWSIPIGWINSLTNYVLIAMNRQRYLTRAFVIGLSFNLLTNLLFIPQYGYIASAITTICSELVLLIAFVYGLQGETGKLNWLELVGRPVLATLIAGLVALALLPLSRYIAFTSVLVVYPLIIWRLHPLTAEERQLLRPTLR